MTNISKNRRNACVLIAFFSLFFLPFMSFAKAKPITTTDLLQHLRKGEPWDRGVMTATKMVMFNQLTFGSNDATVIAKVQLAYFTSPNCTGSTEGGFYNTPDGTSFSISLGVPFGMVAASAWNVGSTQLGIADMTLIQSIAVTFKSTNNNTPQSEFANLSFACVPVTCFGGECLSAASTQNFTLKTIAEVGDAADGGIIGCMNGGLDNIIIARDDSPSYIPWGPNIIDVTNATSQTDGVTNTAAIVLTYGAGTGYAAGFCNEYSATGGYTSGWYLLASGTSPTQQFSCIYTNRVALGIITTDLYWTSTEVGSVASDAIDLGNTGTLFPVLKNRTDIATRCAANFTS